MPRDAPPLPPAAAFTVTRLIRFSHTDPAGIVYFPEYFDMCNALIEDWLAAEVKLDYPTLTLKERLATPAVHAECDFFVPSRWGDRLELSLLIEHLGRSSLGYRILGHAAGRVRLAARIVVAFIHLDSGKPLPLPDGFRQKIEAYRAKTGEPG
jgi:4-hydroxybenzoyl-CoA thioesterase